MPRYRVLIGQAIHHGPTGENHIYDSRDPANNVVETNVNLLRCNGGPGCQPKFELLPEWQQVPPSGWQHNAVPQASDISGNPVPGLAKHPGETLEQYQARARAVLEFNQQQLQRAGLSPAASSGVMPDTPAVAIGQQQAAMPAPQATATTNPGATFDSMTLKELQAFAADEEVDLKNSKDRTEVLKIVKAHAAKVKSHG